MTSSPNLSSGRLLASNTLLNVVGEAAPFVVGIVAIPILIHALGVDRYGVLMLVILAVGYFGAFSYGLGRAATKFIADAFAYDDHPSIHGTFWLSLLLMFGLGVCAATVVAALSPWLTQNVLKIAPAMQGESLHAFYLLALSMPFVISENTFGGMLSAFQRFDLINAVRIPIGILYYIAPLMALALSQRLESIVAAIVIVRCASWLIGFTLCLYIVPELRSLIIPPGTMLFPLLNFGGWVTLSAVVVPLMEYSDRFLMGSILSVAAVAYYTVPYQLTTKLRVLPGALCSVLFPALSSSLNTNPARATLLFERAARYVLLTLFPLVLIAITLAPEGLTLWLGRPFAQHSACTMRWLAMGVFVNSLAFVPDAFVEAANRPDLPAKMHSAAVPAYLLLLWWMLPRYGVAGAAIAYAIRTTTEMIVFFAMARQLLQDLGPGISRGAKIVLADLLVLAVATLPMRLLVKAEFLVATLALYTLFCWLLLLEPDEKEFVRGYLVSMRTLVIGVSE